MQKYVKKNNVGQKMQGLDGFCAQVKKQNIN